MNTLISDLFDRSARTAEARPVLSDQDLLPDEERRVILGAVAKRRAEFATARRLARAALAELGVPPVPLVPRADRSPSWPTGIVGSISHTDDYCAVVVNAISAFRSVGLDVESLRPLEPGIREHVLTQSETRWLECRPAALHDDLTLLFFSAKEAYYKCQYPVSGAFMDFQDVEITIERGHFMAEFRGPSLSPRLTRLSGRFTFRERKVLCGVELPA